MRDFRFNKTAYPVKRIGRFYRCESSLCLLMLSNGGVEQGAYSNVLSVRSNLRLPPEAEKCRVFLPFNVAAVVSAPCAISSSARGAHALRLAYIKAVFPLAVHRLMSTPDSIRAPASTAFQALYSLIRRGIFMEWWLLSIRFTHHFAWFFVSLQ